MVALRAGYEAYRIYDPKALVPLTTHVQLWDDYTARLFRYNHLEMYYHNAVYTDLERYKGVHLEKSNHGLYRFTRAIYNPYARLVDLYADSIYRGRIDYEELSTGAIPFDTLDAGKRSAIRNLLRWSNWQDNMGLYVGEGAKLGDSVIKIVDERDKQKVRLEVQHPGIYRDVEFDAVGNVKSVVIEYKRYDDDQSRFTKEGYLYTEVITQERFETYKDGKPFAYHNDANGNPVSAWDNDYGFVPVAWHKFRPASRADFGLSAGHSVINKIDELNSVASRTHDQIAKMVNAIWAVLGSQGTAQIDLDDSKGTVPIVHLPEGVDMKPLVTQLDIDAAMNAVEKLITEIERDTPELALHRIRQSGNLTAPGVKAGFGDAINKIGGAMNRYDACLVRAIQMALTIGGIGGYDGFQAFDLTSYERGDLELNIKERPVIDDTLSTNEEITFLMQLQDNKLRPLIMQKMGYNRAEIQEADRLQLQAANLAETQDNQVMAAMMQLLASNEETTDETIPREGETVIEATAERQPIS